MYLNLKIYLESSHFVHLMILRTKYKQYWKDFHKTIFSTFWSTVERVEIKYNVRGQLNMTKLTKHVVYFLQNLSGYLIVAPQI